LLRDQSATELRLFADRYRHYRRYASLNVCEKSNRFDGWRFSLATVNQLFEDLKYAGDYSSEVFGQIISVM
jgi:hypothetical protein